MYLKRLQLFNFKNYIETELIFDSKIIGFTGVNGIGKTNILDAIYYLSFCKSFINNTDALSIKHDEDYAMLQGVYDINNSENTVDCTIRKNAKKIFRLNKSEYERLADHIGLIPLITISPYDNCIINEGSNERRKFVDSVICQVDKNYLENVLNYNKILANRNLLLKQFAENKNYDAASIEIWDFQLAELSTHIYNTRLHFVNQFITLFNKYFKLFAQEAELVKIQYSSQLQYETAENLLLQTIDKDRILKYTSTGIHKDDLIFTLQDFPLKRIGSQGQQKSFTIALKLAQYEYIVNQRNIKSILLFDDLFDKLDTQRIEKLLNLIESDSFGQIFITHTDTDKVKSLFSKLSVNAQLFNITVDSIIKV